jgi:hypothetical protein
MHSTSIASLDGLRHVKSAHSTTENGSSRSMVTKREQAEDSKKFLHLNSKNEGNSLLLIYPYFSFKNQ